MGSGKMDSVNHLAEVKKILAGFRSQGFTVLRRNAPVKKDKWYGYSVEYERVKMDLAILFDNLNPDNHVEICLAVNNKMFWNKVGPIGKTRFDVKKEDFVLLLAGAMYDKVPTRELYNTGHDIAFVVKMGPDGRTRIERA